VSSPGVDRPLRTWAQLRRNVGRLVTVSTSGTQQLTGRIVALGPDALTLGRPDGPELTVPVSEVASARVEVEFTHGADSPDDPDGLDDDIDHVDEDE
jgi:ribosome maturation factor RimP